MVERHTTPPTGSRATSPPADMDAWSHAATAVPPPSDILSRALTWGTANLEGVAAARVVAEIATSPAWAARHAYALGYWEGGEDAQARVAAELAALERQLLDLRAALARPWWRLLLGWPTLRRRLGRRAVPA